MIIDLNNCISKPSRDGYGEAIVELGKKDINVVALDADMSKSTRSEWFMKEYPNRFFNMGIAEQDMISTAAGLALAGKVPFASSYGVFVTGRAWDQIRTTVCYTNLNVKFAGHSGITIGPDGATHQALEDIAIMRVLPNMTVLAPCDAIEMKKATLAAYEINGPVYIRFTRENTPVFTEDSDPFVLGKANMLMDGHDLTIIGCGPILYHALKAANALKAEGISARVLNMHTIKPIDVDAVVRAAKDTGAIITVEEHQIHGGLGSAVSECVVRNCPVPMEMVAIADTFGETGNPDELIKAYNLSADSIVDAAKKILGRK